MLYARKIVILDMLESRVSMRTHPGGSRLSRLPLRRLAEVVERADDLKERVRRGLADAVVVVREERDELER